MKGNNTPVKAFSKQLKKAEAYLRDTCPGAQIPQNLLKEHLFDSIKELDDRRFNSAQGELLGLGITKITWNLETGRKRRDGRRHEFFVAFPSGEMRSHISICAILTRLISRRGGSEMGREGIGWGTDVTSSILGGEMYIRRSFSTAD